MKSRTVYTPVLLSTLVSAALPGCTSVINQNTDGNQVYTGVDDDATIALDLTEGDAEADASSGETVGDSSSTTGSSSSEGGLMSGGDETSIGTDSTTSVDDSEGGSMSGAPDDDFRGDDFRGDMKGSLSPPPVVTADYQGIPCPTLPLLKKLKCELETNDDHLEN